MAIDKSSLGRPRELGAARIAAHVAVQPLSKAARANMTAREDDSHSSVEWIPEDAMFRTHAFEGTGAVVHVGLGLVPLRMVVLRDGEPVAELDLAGKGTDDAESWLDAELMRLGLAPASPIEQPFEMPEDTRALTVYPADQSGLAELAEWYSLGKAALEQVVPDAAGEKPGPSPIVCWPHHFDIATYVGLEEGDFETARGIGIGLSPGDETYDQPYVFIYPWPRPNPADLPDDPIAPGRWQSEGFTGSGATGEALAELDDPLAGTVSFMRESYAAAHRLLTP